MGHRKFANRPSSFWLQPPGRDRLCLYLFHILPQCLVLGHKHRGHSVHIVSHPMDWGHSRKESRKNAKATHRESELILKRTYFLSPLPATILFFSSWQTYVPEQLFRDYWKEVVIFPLCY